MVSYSTLSSPRLGSGSQPTAFLLSNPADLFLHRLSRCSDATSLPGLKKCFYPAAGEGQISGAELRTQEFCEQGTIQLLPNFCSSKALKVH